MNYQTINHNLQVARSLAEPYYKNGQKEIGIAIIQLASKVALHQLDQLRESEQNNLEDLEQQEALQANLEEAESTGN